MRNSILRLHLAKIYDTISKTDKQTLKIFIFSSEQKLCSVEGTMPCKGYGECVMRKWVEKGQTNCIDKSDQGYR